MVAGQFLYYVSSCKSRSIAFTLHVLESSLVWSSWLFDTFCSVLVGRSCLMRGRVCHLSVIIIGSCQYVHKNIYILHVITWQNISHFEVEVTLRPTVSRSLRPGVLPLLEQVTRCYIYLSDNYFLYFSCRAPSLTRGRVCNLQCIYTSSVSSYIATDGLSASSSWCRAPDGAPNQILISLFDSYFVFSV
jgi:hypothetical protein